MDDNFTLEQSQLLIDEKVWRPTRQFGQSLDDLAIRNNLNRVTSLVLQPPITTPLQPPDTSGTNNIPSHLLSLSATETPTVVQGGTMSEVSVSFTYDATDPNFAGIHIWFKGYKGDPNPQLMTDGVTSPTSFIVETTGEAVTVLAQPFNTSYQSADLSFASTTTVLLDGVISAPPAPSIAQTLVTTPTGLQFAFNQEGGLLADVISCYKVYHNTTNSSGSATVYQTFPQDPKNVGQIVVQETLPNGTIMFYWVSAVNTSGLESSLTAVSGSGIPSGLAIAGDNLVRNGDFSAGLANWTATSSTSEIFSGVSNLPVGNTELKTSASKVLETDDFIPIDPNRSYLMSCWVRLASNTSGNFYGGLKEYDSTKTGITHVTAGNDSAYCLFRNITKTSGNSGSEPSTNGFQFFQGIISGPMVSPGATPAPGIFQFASGTQYVRPRFFLNNTGTPQQIEIVNVRLSAVEAVSQQAYMKASGINLIANSDFLGGSSSGYSVYDNNSTGNVTISVVTDSTAPNSTGKALQISTAAGTAPNPGLGGFFVALPVDSGTLQLGSYHKGDRLLFRLKANIPEGGTLHYNTNAYGDSGTIRWITGQAGRGQYVDYMVLVTPGASGSFSTIGFFYLDSTLTAPQTWKVAVFEAVDLEHQQFTNNVYQLTRQGVSTSLLTQGSIIPTQAFTITFTSTSTSLSLSWSSATLFRSDGSTFVVASGTKNYTSLSSSTTYYIYPYIDLVNLVIAFTNPTPPGTSINSTQAVECNFDLRSGLSAMVLTTPASGGGGGSGGDGGSGGGGAPCPEENELVEVLRVQNVHGKHITVVRDGRTLTVNPHEVLPSDGQILQIKVGTINPQTDLLKGYSFKHQKDVYRRLKNKHLRGCAAWRIVDGYKVTPCEPIWKNNQWMPAYKAPGAVIDYSVGIRVDLVVDTGADEEHNYYVVGRGEPLLIHNFFVLPC